MVCAATGDIDYFECLLRMRDMQGGIVAGHEFISPIEKLGLIGLIDDYVLEQTVQELARYPEIRLGLNISGLTACNGSWLHSLLRHVQDRPDVARRGRYPDGAAVLEHRRHVALERVIGGR